MITHSRLPAFSSTDLCQNANLSRPTEDEIANEWNNNVHTRAQELESGVDSTYFEVIVPYIQSALREFDLCKTKLLDAGCGLGHITNLISSWGFKVTGIDIAEKAIEYAKGSFKSPDFERTSIISFSRSHFEEFDVCIANMVLHNLVNLNENLCAINALLKNEGLVIASIPNPKSWLKRHIGEKDCFFEYNQDRIYKIQFKINQGEAHPSFITYIHRPISLYKKYIRSAGFEIVKSENPPGKDCTIDDDILFCLWQKRRSL